MDAVGGSLTRMVTCAVSVAPSSSATVSVMTCVPMDRFDVLNVSLLLKSPSMLEFH